jgi:ATP/ADP translocase
LTILFVNALFPRAIIAAMGSVAALSASGVARFLSFVAIFLVQAQFFPSITTWHASQAVIPVTFVIIADLLCRLTTQTISKPVRESLWVHIPKENKYRSKIIVDVLAHRIGTSTAAFLANVPILQVVNQVLLSSPLFAQIYRTVIGRDGVEFIGYKGQDHIVWGLLATSLLCYTALCLGFAVVKVKDKTD